MSSAIRFNEPVRLTRRNLRAITAAVAEGRRADADAIADAVLNRLAAEESATAKRRLIAVSFMTAIFVLLCAVLLPRHQPADTALESTAPGSVSASGLTEGSSTTVQVQLRRLRVLERPSDEASSRPRSIRLRLQVAASDCRRLLKDLGGRCDGRDEASRAEQPVSLRLSSSTLIRVETQNWRLRPQLPHDGSDQPVAWRYDPDGPRTDIVVDCAAPDVLRVSGAATTTVKARACPARDATEYEVRLAAGASDPVLLMTDVRRLDAAFTPPTLETRMSSGTITLGNRTEQAPSGSLVAIRAEEGEQLHADLRAAGARSALTVRGLASSVRVDDRETLPTRFEKNQDIWLAIIGLALSLFASVMLQLLLHIRRPRVP